MLRILTKIFMLQKFLPENIPAENKSEVLFFRSQNVKFCNVLKHSILLPPKYVRTLLKSIQKMFFQTKMLFENFLYNLPLSSKKHKPFLLPNEKNCFFCSISAHT